MAVYTGGQSIVDAALGQYRNLGFSLVEAADHRLALRYKGVELERYNQLTITVETIRRQCHVFQTFVERLMGL